MWCAKLEMYYLFLQDPGIADYCLQSKHHCKHSKLINYYWLINTSAYSASSLQEDINLTKLKIES